MRSVYGSPDAQAHDAHLRSLSPRAGTLDRYSVASDAPSVYSRVDYEPTDGHTFLSDYYHPHDGLERFQDRHTSNIDFGDDRSSPSSTSDNDDDDSHSFEQEQGEIGDRMSYLGPKMRFHSLAPWEMGADTLDEADEPTESPKTTINIFPNPFGAHKVSSVSSSPRPSHSTTSRPSEDSWKANVHAKRSFDTINSQMSSKGTLYALAQESLSATSLGKSVPRDGILSKFSGLGRARTPTISSTHSTAPPSPPAPTAQQPRKQRHQPPPPLTTSRTTAHETYDTKHSTDYSAGESFHPYANPDLMPPSSLAAPPVSPMSVQFPHGPSEPWETQRDSSYPKPISSVAAPPLSPKSMQFPRSQMDPVFNPQRTSIQRGKRASSIQGKGISSPIAVQGSALPPSMSNESAGLGNGLPGWTDRVVPPSFSLISLEEARAQQGKTTTTNADELSRTLSSNTTISTTDSSGTGAPIASSAASARSSRARTLSAGAKAKNAIQSMVANGKLDRRDSEPAVPVIGKTLKHKKSGFMRLFNKDKEEAPPVPPLTLVTSLDNESWKRSAVPQLARDDEARSPNRSHKHSPPSLQLAGGADTLSPIDNPPLTKPWANPQPASAPADVTSFPPLRLRPVSTIFSAQFESFAPELSSNASERHHRDIDTPTSSSPPEQMSPITPGPNSDFFPSSKRDDHSAATIKALREELASTKATSERRIRDLESQIRELKLEVEELRSFDRRSRTSSMSAHCDNCSNESEGTVGGGYLSVTPRRGGGGNSPNGSLLSVGTSVLHRPRAKTGNGSSRFVNADS